MLTTFLLLGHLIWVQYVGAQTINERCGIASFCTNGSVIYVWEAYARPDKELDRLLTPAQKKMGLEHGIKHEAEHCYATILGLAHDRTHWEGNKGFKEAWESVIFQK